MQIEEIKDRSYEGLRRCHWSMERISDTELVAKLDVDDFFYSFKIRVRGSEEELDAVQRFCRGANGLYYHMEDDPDGKIMDAQLRKDSFEFVDGCLHSITPLSSSTPQSSE